MNTKDINYVRLPLRHLKYGDIFVYYLEEIPLKKYRINLKYIGDTGYAYIHTPNIGLDWNRDGETKVYKLGSIEDLGEILANCIHEGLIKHDRD